MNKISILLRNKIRICFESKDKVDMDLERFADLMKKMIEKYIDKIDLDSYPDPPRPTINKIVGLLNALKNGICLVIMCNKVYNYISNNDYDIYTMSKLMERG